MAALQLPHLPTPLFRLQYMPSPWRTVSWWGLTTTIAPKTGPDWEALRNDCRTSLTVGNRVHCWITAAPTSSAPDERPTPENQPSLHLARLSSVVHRFCSLTGSRLPPGRHAVR